MADLITETHGLVREIKGKLEGIEASVADGKRQRNEICGRMTDLERSMVNKSECEKIHAAVENNIPQVVEQAVTRAINGKKRSRWLVIKDILLITIAPLATAIIGYMFYVVSKGKFIP